MVYLKELAGYWANGFDWQAAEAALNEIPQFVTEINGQRIHFFHQRSTEPDATPLILTHGWPGSPVEFQRLVGPLTDPAAHGGDPADAFHVVVPSLPGYGFSNPLGEGGFNLFGVAQMWAELMSRLGYDRYAAHGTDAGSGVAGMLPMVDAAHVIGIHLAGVSAAAPFGEWTDPANKLPEDAVDRDQLLTNVSLYWFTGSGASSAHAVYEGMAAWNAMLAMQSGDGGSWGDAGGTGEDQAWGAVAGPPTGVAVFGNETAIKSLTDPEGKIEHWVEYERGGHFAAMEVPELLTADLRTFFRPLR